MAHDLSSRAASSGDDSPESTPDTLAFLSELAGSLCGALTDNGGNYLVHVKQAADGYDVGTLALEGRHPADLLLGTVAPPDWIALGVATCGRARALDGGHRQGPDRAVVVVLVHRDGAVVGRLRLGDKVIDETPGYGLTLDCLQRAFGLPAAPPLVTTGTRFTAAWLDNVVLAARSSPAGLSWPAVVALHPAASLLGGWSEGPPAEHGTGAGVGRPTSLLDGQGGDAEDLVAAAWALEQCCDWERLRWLVVEESWQERGITPVDAAWLDAGSFSRWALAPVAPVHLLLNDVRRAAGPAIFRRCRAVVRQLGLRAGDEVRPGHGSAA